MSMDAALQTFFAEADELLEYMESALLRIEDGEPDSETLNEIFRAAHTIKGSAGLFGLHNIVGFTHFVENVLDRTRSGDIIIDHDLQGILLHCKDHIARLVSDQKSNREISEEVIHKGEALLQQLHPWLESNGQPAINLDSAAENGSDVQSENQHSEDAWLISLRLDPDVLRNGMDPLSFIQFLSGMGKITNLTTLDDGLPQTADEFDPETLYLGFEIGLVTEASRSEIEDVFCFVKDGSDICLLPPSSKITEYIERIRSLPESNQKLGEILVKSSIITQRDLDLALDEQTVQAASKQATPQMLGEILASSQVVPSVVVDAALDKQKKFTEQRPVQESRFVRVDAEKLDNLINLIGELVISRQRVDLLAAQTEHGPLLDAVASLGGFTEHIRDAALTLRMVPIGDTFQRFRRLVRDSATELGKSIELKIRGAETELDRSMVEKLTDPLTHIVRNAVDHGIEDPELRKQCGKSETGTLCLSAYHDAGIIVIEVSDDGGGLNLEKIRAKAIANGVIDSGVTLTDYDYQQLIFHPGLSTAEKVTDLSGRGVGMDVVKRNIDALQGSVEIDSKPNQGTRLRIRLPLTLAIIDGFHVASSNTHFIIPQNTVLECMDLDSLSQDEGRNCVNLRGEQIPFVRLSNIFALPERVEDFETPREKLVVVQFGDTRAGIVVESLFGEVQTVVKPLSPIFQALQGVGGSSLLGTGDIAFILDVPQLIELSVRREDRINRSGFRITAKEK